MEKWNRTHPDDMPVRPSKGPIYTMDFAVMSYLALRIEEGS